MNANRKKTVVLVNQYFYPDVAATSQLLGDLAQWMGAAGWNVVAVAGRSRYTAGVESGQASGRIWNGVQVRRVWCTNFGRSRALGRICDYLTFLCSAGIFLAFASKPDVVVCLSTPPLVAVLGVLAQFKGSRLIYKVEDIYPEVAVALAAIREGSLLSRALSQISRFVLRRAERVVTLDESMSDRLQKGGAQRVDTIPNWADGDAIQTDPAAGARFRSFHGLKGRFVILYSGNLGLAHRFDAVMEAARQCADTLPEVLFLFVGGGARLGEVRDASIGLHNVRFMDYQPRAQLNALYNAADVHLVTMCDEVSGLLFPSKYPAALAAGKPVLLVGGLEAPLQLEIETKELGWTCPHRGGSVFDAIRDAVVHPERRQAMGKNGRALFDSRYSKTVALRQWEQILNSAILS